MEKSNSVTGYSIDNLPPCQPLNLQAELFGNTEVKLLWDKNLESDFSYYAIYKGAGEGFAPNEGILLTTTTDTSFTDNEIMDGSWYYRISAFDFNGNESEYSQEVGVLVGVEEENQLPTEYSLSQNYPNPFNPSTMIKYGVPEESNIKIEIFNMLGQSLGLLVNSKNSAGYYEATWNASNLPSGIYIISIKAVGVNSQKNFNQVKKALLLK